MKIGEVGNNFVDTERINYLSNSTFLDYDLIIIDLDFLCSLGISGGPNSVTIFLKRKEDLTNFFSHKNVPLIIINANNNKILLTQSSAGIYHDVSYILPIDEFNLVSESGSRTEIQNNTPFTEFFKKYESLISYSSYFKLHKGTVLIRTPYNKKVLSFYDKHVIFMPKLIFIDKNSQNNFLTELYEIALKINEDHGSILLPKWTEQYFLPKEKEIFNNIHDITIEIDNKNIQLNEAKMNLEGVRINKVLFSGTGGELELQVKNIFTALGFKIKDAEQNRDDLIVEFNGKTAVIEIKGVTGSAAEKHAAQLEKWVSNYYAENGIEPKGILLVNAFRETDLVSRSEAFPHQMIAYSVKKEHCLMTTIQLMGLYYDALNNEGKKAELIETLFTTIGVYENYRDWTKFISVG